MDRLTEDAWQAYREQGFLRLGKVVPPKNINALRQRIDEIMLGKAHCEYDKMLMQLDSTSGDYSDLSSQGSGHKGATLNYRKIQDLELDRLFLEYLQHPLFEDICKRAYGPESNIDIFRAMFMNKPSGKGTYLPWHQDRWRSLDRDPEITIWTALDPATIENGCVQVIPGSHGNLLNPDHPSGFLNEDLTAEHCDLNKRVFLELEVGESVLLHNWLLHSSDKNKSSISRRAFSVCYMDASTAMINQESHYPYRRAFGENALSPHGSGRQPTG